MNNEIQHTPEQFEGHTPGPWRTQSQFAHKEECTSVFSNEKASDGHSKCVATLIGSRLSLLPLKERNANAKLIASAPSLLKENQELKRWKEEALIVLKSWDRVDEYIQSHPEIKLGTTKSEAALTLLKERDELKEENERLKAVQGDLINADQTIDHLKAINEELVKALDGLSHLWTGREDWPEVQIALQALSKSKAQTP